jgi:uncharacterized protein YodC (DUF2158 family)
MSNTIEVNPPPKPGDIVSLRSSDGPEMVVSQVATRDSVVVCTCIWFEDCQSSSDENAPPRWKLQSVDVPAITLDVHGDEDEDEG